LGDTKIKATLDGNTISCTYYRIFSTGEDISPVDLSIQVIHQFLDSEDTLKEIVLESFSVPKNYLETKSVSYLSNELHQKADFTILNLRYLTNIFIKVDEIRGSAPISTTGEVLFGDDITIESLPDNPQKDIENDENQPELVPMPEENIVILEKEMTTEYYSLEKDGFSSIQAAMKIYLNQNVFVLQEYNTESPRLFIENSVNNLILNNKFTDQPDQERVPGEWSIISSGIIVNSHIMPLTEIEGINFWQLRITNPNLFSAFNSVTVANDIAELPTGLENISFSVYYRVKPTGKQFPFNSISVFFKYFLDDFELSTEEVVVSWQESKNLWDLLTATSAVPSNANKYSIELDICGIDITDLFSFDLCLPQVENNIFSTTRIISQRVQDKITTSREIVLEKPYYVSLKTEHISNTRSWFSSTTNQKSGIELIATANSLILKSYDATGNLENNLSSSAFTAINGSVVEYGAWVKENAVDFYVNKNLLSTASLSFPIPNKIAMCMVGSSEVDNTTINDELFGFTISSKP